MEKVMSSTVIKTGTSMAVVIPVQILRALKINKGDMVTFAVYEDRSICIKVLTDKEARSLKPNRVIEW